MAIDRLERYSRQAALVPADKLTDMQVTVIGVGAIGRQVALQLSAMGVPNVQVIDFDTVEDGNLAAQGFMEEDLGKPKVEAIRDLCLRINSEVNLDVINDRYRRGMTVGRVVFCCVDKIDIREFIWNAVKNSCDLFIDGRMSAEALRILVSSDKESKEYYPTTLFTADEAFQGTCTAKSTIYSSNVIAGIMVAQLAKWLREMPLDCDIQFNLLTNEITAGTPADYARAAKKAAEAEEVQVED